MIYRALLLLLILSTTGAQAEEKIWLGLYLGQNAHEPALEEEYASPDLTQRLASVFGYPQYRLLKTETVSLIHPIKQFVLPRKDFYISLKPHPALEGTPWTVDYQLYHKEGIVAQGTYYPQPGTPVFIEGPDYHQGKLIFVLKMRTKSEP